MEALQVDSRPLDRTGKGHYRRAVLYAIYNILLLAGSLVLIPYFGLKMLMTGKYRQSFGQKLGWTPAEVISAIEGHPRIWVHAVSVGEVTAAAPIVAMLREKFPRACIILSTATETGQAMALRLIPQATAFIYFPLDIPFVVRKVIDRIAPDIVVLTETELWPNFLRHCMKRRIPVVMVNGRISPRSFRRYSRTSFFWSGRSELCSRRSASFPKWMRNGFERSGPHRRRCASWGMPSTTSSPRG